jgi:hypothetical protein
MSRVAPARPQVGLVASERGMSYAVLESARTFGRRPRAFMACHRSHFAWSANQICASHRVSGARNRDTQSALIEWVLQSL